MISELLNDLKMAFKMKAPSQPTYSNMLTAAANIYQIAENGDGLIFLVLWNRSNLQTYF